MNYFLKKLNKEHDSVIFIVDSGATSHMVKSENYITKLKDTRTRVTIWDRRTLTGTKHGNWHDWNKRSRKLHPVTLTNMVVIPCLHPNLFNVAWALQKGFQLTSEGETLILKKISTVIVFDKKVANKSGKGFLLTTKFYKIAYDADLLAPKKQKPVGEAYI